MKRPVLRTALTVLALLTPGVSTAKSSTIYKGKLTESCAPWDGPAFDIRLDNRLTVHVYETLGPNIVGKTIRLGMQQENAGGGVIMRCGPPYNGCVMYEGTISITAIEGDFISGKIAIAQKDLNLKYDFRVKHDHSFHPVCG